MRFDNVFVMVYSDMTIYIGWLWPLKAFRCLKTKKLIALQERIYNTKTNNLITFLAGC